jgi:hypothetical protein
MFHLLELTEIPTPLPPHGGRRMLITYQHHVLACPCSISRFFISFFQFQVDRYKRGKTSGDPNHVLNENLHLHLGTKAAD